MDGIVAGGVPQSYGVAHAFDLSTNTCSFYTYETSHVKWNSGGHQYIAKSDGYYLYFTSTSNSKIVYMTANSSVSDGWWSTSLNAWLSGLIYLHP